MPKALDPRMLLSAGRPQPKAVEAEPVEEDVEARAEPSAPPAPSRPRPARGRKPARAQPRAAPRRTPRQTEAGQLHPVGALLSAAQVAWLYRVVGQASGERRRVSHSELVRLAIDRFRTDHDPRRAAALVVSAPPADGEYGSYALSGDQVGWLREVKGHALLARMSVSQADVIRAAMEPLIGLAWRDLRDAVG